jgi:hypothetical protein
MLVHERSNGIEYDVDPPGLLYGAVDVFVTAPSTRVFMTAACARPPNAVNCFVTSSTFDLVRPGEKPPHLELLCHRGADRTSSPEYDGTFFLQDW